MKFIKLSLILIAVSLFLISCAKTEPSPGGNNAGVANATINTVENTNQSVAPIAGADFAAAKNIYDQKCVKCHLESGEGGKIQIDTVSLKVPNFRDPRNQDDDPDDYIERVEKGASGKMPAFKGKLTDDEIKSVVAYIRHQYQGK